MIDCEKERAKEIILEIIRQAGGVFDLETNLYKAFYHAHLRYANTHRGYLSTWPIVRMPHGPGINDCKDLLRELAKAGKIKISKFKCQGGYDGRRFTLLTNDIDCSRLPRGATKAIAYGVEQVKGKTAKQTSHESHIKSRAWKEAEDGDELNIYTDSLSDDEYEREKQDIKRLQRILKDALS